MGVLDVPFDKNLYATTAQVAPGVRLYNPKGLRRWSQALADALDGQAVINVLGDSIATGVGSDGSGTASSGADATYRLSGLVGVLQRRFAATYGDCGEGGIFRLDNAVRVTLAGGATASASVGPLRSGISLASNTQTATFTTPVCTEIDVYTWHGSSATVGTYNVDAGAATGNLTAGNGANTGIVFDKKTITGLASTTHSIVLTGPASGTTFVAAIVPRKLTTGVLISRWAIPGVTTANLVGLDSTLNGNATGQARMIAASVAVPSAHLVVVPLGVNDFGNQNSLSAGGTNPGTTPTTYSANLATLATAAIANGACVLFVGEPRQNLANYPSPATYAEQDYYDAAKALAVATDHCAFLDINDLWGSNVLGNTAGFYNTTSVHPTRKGHGSICRLLHLALTMPCGENALAR